MNPVDYANRQILKLERKLKYWRSIRQKWKGEPTPAQPPPPPLPQKGQPQSWVDDLGGKAALERLVMGVIISRGPQSPAALAKQLGVFQSDVCKALEGSLVLDLENGRYGITPAGYRELKEE